MIDLKNFVLSLIVVMSVMGGGYYLFFCSGEKISTVFSYALYPVLLIQKEVVDSIKKVTDDRRDMAHMQDTLIALKMACESLRAENIQLMATQKYAQDIEEIDFFRRQYNYERTRIAQILSKNFSAKEHYFLIEGGGDKGMRQDMVVVYKNCLIGKIEQVYPWYSKVRLVTDASCKVAAYCARTNSNGIYQGSNNSEYALLQYMPHFKEIVVGDTVVSSGEGIIFPAGFSLGVIASYTTDSLYHSIRVTPSVDLQTLSYCVVLIDRS